MKKRVGVLFGGQSEEHEVSIRSAESVIKYLDPKKYEVIPIKIEKDGTWGWESSLSLLKESFDVIFPVLHGPYGEDGTVQGLLELAHLPYVGADPLSSAMCMDKGVMKDRLRGAGLPVPDYLLLSIVDSIQEEDIFKRFSFPFFVKPARLGSSVGISKVHCREELFPALEESFKHDERIVIEEGIVGQELEISVLGNLAPEASLPGEIIPTHEFYSYEAKYLDENGAHFVLPAKLPSKRIQEIQELGVEAFKVMRCEGMARVDFFLSSEGTLYINELNTIPGFTSISLYPKLWEVSGLPYSALLDRLIDLAIERFERIHDDERFVLNRLMNYH
ncbi:MAG: D-alanine--D-alanine ligase [Chlamydiia bacterium]|nr:D-alanine--D-alanine ligase [Chlamydiia bacterium]